MEDSTIYDYIKREESNFETDEIQLGDNWWWNFRKHVQLIFHLKNGVFFTGENNWLRAFKNIMEPILELSYWTEDIEVKDVVFTLEGKDDKALSFLIKKYHDEVYVREHDLDTMFDEITESDVDYGGTLVQQSKDRPEVLALNSIAFCDQTDIEGGPIAFKFSFSPSKLKSMSKYGWGEEKNGADISLEDLCVLATDEKDVLGVYDKQKNKVPGKTIDVYIVRGDMPEAWLEDNDNMEDSVNQIQIVAFYIDKEGTKQGVTLYKKKDEDSLMFFTSKTISGRALGRGVGERLLGPQIWTNFLTIHKTAMLEAGSKVPLYTDDTSYNQKNKIQDMENLEITTIEDGKRIYQVPTVAPANIQLYGNEINDWYSFAQLTGSAQDPILGKEAASGTTFRGQERSVAQAKGGHERRRGKRAKFIEEIYRRFIIDDIVKEITKGKKFLATLSTEELTWVTEQVVNNQVNQKIKDKMINTGKPVSLEEQENIRQVYRQAFLKRGNKQLFETLKDEFKDIEIKIGINVAGKQKDLVQLSDKLLSIFQFIFANPQGFQQAMQVPALAKSFENILEFGGMSIADFSSLLNAPVLSPIQMADQSGQESPAQPQLALGTSNA